VPGQKSDENAGKGVDRGLERLPSEFIRAAPSGLSQETLLEKKEIPMNPFRKSVWQNRGTVSILASAIVLLVSASGLITASAAEKPNVLYILCDDLRPEAIGCLG